MSDAAAKAGCAALFESDMARMVLGETLHPGGLGLTNRLARLTGIEQGELVLDLACARGVSAAAVSRAFHCRVVGVEFGEAPLKKAVAGAPSSVRLVRGDAESPPFGNGSFDRALCECSMSLFPDKDKAVAATARLLKQGGSFGLSDVAIEPGALPPELEGELGQMLCLTGALTKQGYRRLLERGGFTVTSEFDASSEISKILNDVGMKLAAYTTFQRLLGRPVEGLPTRGPALLSTLRRLVNDGKLGYWLFVGQKVESRE